MGDTDLYEVLEVTRNASDADIRRVRSDLIFSSLFYYSICSPIIV